MTNATDKTVTLDGAKWYHLKLVVTATSVDYTISEYAENGSSEMSVITNGTGSLSVASLPTVKGFWALLGRKASSNNGLLNFANFEMYDYSLLPQMTKTRSLNFKDIAGSVLNKTSNTSCTLTFDEKGADNHYAITTEGFNSDFAVSTNNTDKGWFLRYYGATKEANTGLWLYNSDGTMSVRNLPRGAWVTFNASAAVTASSNAVSSTDVASVSGSTYAFQVSDAGYATFAATKNSYVYSMDVYEPVNEVIGLLDKTTSYDTSIRGTVNKGLTILQGEQIMLNMNVRGNGANNWNGWSLRIANSDTSYDRALAGGNHINKEGSDAGIDNAYDGITQKWYYDGVDNYSSFMAAYKTQMMDANVDMTIEYGTDGLLTVTAESTMGGHNYKYEFVRTVAFSGAVTMKLGVDCAWLEILSTERTVSKSITTAGWATYCSPYALDLSGATGLTDAYIVTGGKKGVLTKTSVKGGTVPANTGLLLKGTEGSAVNVTIPVVASSETIVTGNILDGVTANTEIAAGSGWVLMDDATNGLGFYQNTNAFTVGANTAYIPVADLAVPGAGARAFYSLFDNETTGVDAALVKNGIVNNEIFNLQGQRVGQPTKGLYIVGGRKVVKK